MSNGLKCCNMQPTHSVLFVVRKPPDGRLSFSAGPVFGNMDQFIGLGIFVDTYPNADKTHDVSDSW